MDKSVLRNFAIYSRNKLIKDIINKSKLIGITDKGIKKTLSESGDMITFDIKSAESYKIHGNEVTQYKGLIEELMEREAKTDYKTAYNSLVEEIAYTWFNRLIALRFMEVNNYLPDKMRVLSSGRTGVDEPEFVTHYDDTSLNFTSKELQEILDLKLDGSAKSMEEIFHLMFIKECNRLNKHLPELFKEIDDYAELLLNISYIDEEGVVYKLVHDIPEDYFDIEEGHGQVEIIGWMYQYYNTERKDEVINVIGKGLIKKEDIPAATQLFTTDWVVKYMVDNSLGKYWLERNPESNIRKSLEYLMPGEISVIDEKISPKDLKVLDNAMGSGHCLSYAFDVLMMIYESEGYTKREAAKSIIENNLYGLDIDKRAYQLAYFAIMMKARQYNRGILSGESETNLGVFQDSIDINKGHLEYLGLSMNPLSRKTALNQINYLIDEFENSRELGSIIIIENIDKDLLLEFINDNSSYGQISMGESNMEKTQNDLRRLVKVASMLTEKYHTVVTNPPYLNKFSPALKKYVNDNYSDYKGDLFSVFIYRNVEFTRVNGYSAYMTPNVWMFIKSYENLRKYLILQRHIDSLIQIAKGSFYREATVDVMTFVIKNNKSNNNGKFIRLEDFKGDMEVQRIKTLEAINNPKCGYYYERDQNNFDKIPGMPVAYWASDKIIDTFKYKTSIINVAPPRKGLVTMDNNRFLKMWYEIELFKFSDSIEEPIEFYNSQIKWVPHSKGGPFRKWYGNRDYVINWENNGSELKSFIVEKYNGGSYTKEIRSESMYFKPMLCWSGISSGNISFRLNKKGFVFDTSGPAAFPKANANYILGLLNSSLVKTILEFISPTLSFLSGDIAMLPFNLPEKYVLEVENIVNYNIYTSKNDWDSFETSWDFITHPLIKFRRSNALWGEPKENEIQEFKDNGSIELSYKAWKNFTNSQFTQLKFNEEELNRIFIEIYGLEDELTPEVSDKDITIAKIFDTKEEIYDDIKGNRYILTKEDVIKSFISYAVGCIFGRYSLDVEGLAHAGGDWDSSKYTRFIPTKDNIILISDEEYFEDDIVNRFVEFVKVVYGKETLEENLIFIAHALGGRGEPKETIRNYFLKDFYKDHVQKYQKRPIYWLYDSGKQNGFKALIYMHRYNEDTTGKVRISYLHELQKAYERAMDNLRHEIANNKNPREVAQAEKGLNKLTKQLKECKDYDENIGHLALARIPIDLDDGVKVNYEKVQTDEKGKKLEILGKI